MTREVLLEVCRERRNCEMGHTWGLHKRWMVSHRGAVGLSPAMFSCLDANTWSEWDLAGCVRYKDIVSICKENIIINGLWNLTRDEGTNKTVWQRNVIGAINGKSQCSWRIIGSVFSEGWSQKIGDGDLSQMLGMKILEAAQLFVITRSRTLIWEWVEGRLLQQGQVSVLI